MKVAIIFNKDMTGIINILGIQNKEKYNPVTVKLVAEALELGGHNVSIIDGNMNVIEILQAFMPKVLEGEKMGMVFNMAYGIQGESRYTHIPSMLEMLGIPYVGSSPSGHALALDKVLTKIIMQQNHIPTPEFWVFSSKSDDMQLVKYPAIVKPKMESVSFGLRIVNNIDELRNAVDYIIHEFKQQALVEQFIRGREFAVGLLGNDPVEAFPVLEIDLEGNPDAIQTVEDKQKKPRNKICPANISPEIAEKMTNLSIAAFKALQLRDFSRVDIRMDENENIYLLEINSMASLGRTGSYVHAAKSVGYTYNSLVNKMLDVAAVRYFSNTNLNTLNPEHEKKTPLHVRIRTFLRSKEDFACEFLQKIVDINTHVRNVDGVNQLSSLLVKQLSALDFHHEVIPQIEVGHILFFCNNPDNEYDVLILGNLDNPVKNSNHQYFRKDGQKFYGSGIWEHKGGLVVLLLALQALRFCKVLRRVKIGILLTSDDTLQGRFARNEIIEKSSKAKYVIGMHGAFLDGGLVTSRSGASVYKCSMNLRNTDNAQNVAIAISVFSKLIASWADMTDIEKGIVISPSDVKMTSNITEPYAHAEASLSIRYNEPEQITAFEKKMKKLIPSKYKDLLHIQIEGGVRRPPMRNTPQIEEFWKIIQELAQILDTRLRREHRWSSADIGFVEPGKHAIGGFGPVGTNPPSKSEYILKHSIAEMAALLAMTLNRIGG